MNSSVSGRGISPWASLRRLARKRAAEERCELCSIGLAASHRHLFETASRNIVCACDPCAMRFQAAQGGRFKLIPRDARLLPDFRLSDAQWESLALPINLAFFFHRSLDGKMVALYPSPAGATESLLPLENWRDLVEDNPALAEMQPDVQALLINRIGTTRHSLIAPIDVCFELAGLIRLRWRGLSGGEAVWEEIEAFFNRLNEQAVEAAPVDQPALLIAEATHA